jgi:hypothetical protein
MAINFYLATPALARSYCHVLKHQSFEDRSQTRPKRYRPLKAQSARMHQQSAAKHQLVGRFDQTVAAVAECWPLRQNRDSSLFGNLTVTDPTKTQR